jgi:hypothetical protein
MEAYSIRASYVGKFITNCKRVLLVNLWSNKPGNWHDSVIAINTQEEKSLHYVLPVLTTKKSKFGLHSAFLCFTRCSKKQTNGFS